MIISLMLLLSNTNLLATSFVAGSADRRRDGDGYVLSEATASGPDGFAAVNVEAFGGPDEWPLAL